MNWKIILGLLIVFGAASEMLSIIQDYNSGKLKFWPFGADFGCLALIILGMYPINKGRKEKKKIF